MGNSKWYGKLVKVIKNNKSHESIKSQSEVFTYDYTLEKNIKRKIAKADKRLEALASKLWKKNSNQRNYTRIDLGVAKSAAFSPRNQRSIVKVSYTELVKKTKWANHGRYLMRDGAQHEDGLGVGFSERSDDVDLAQMLNSWQDSNDPRYFRMIISPENGGLLNMQDHVKKLMKRVQDGLGVRLEWGGIDHSNTDNSHAHVVFRGVDKRGNEIRINKNYIANEIRNISEDLATRKLGLRTSIDALRGLKRCVLQDAYTELDFQIGEKLIDDLVSFGSNSPINMYQKEIWKSQLQRVQYLESIGLAERLGDAEWSLKSNYKKTLQDMQLRKDIIKSRALRHQKGFVAEDFDFHVEKVIVGIGESLVGKVISSGIASELYDTRYLLLEGIDGKYKYVVMPPSIAAKREDDSIKNNHIVTLTGVQYEIDDKLIKSMQCNCFSSLEHDFESPNSSFDIMAQQFLKGGALSNCKSDFTTSYYSFLQRRADDLIACGAIDKDGYQVNEAAMEKLKFSRAVKTYEVLGDCNEPNYGDVVCTTSSSFLVRALNNTYIKIELSDIGWSVPPKLHDTLMFASLRKRDDDSDRCAWSKRVDLKKLLHASQQNLLNELDALLNKYESFDEQVSIGKAMAKRKNIWEKRGKDFSLSEKEYWLARFGSIESFEQNTKQKVHYCDTPKNIKGLKVVATDIDGKDGDKYMLLQKGKDYSAIKASARSARHLRVGDVFDIDRSVTELKGKVKFKVTKLKKGKIV